MVSCDPPIIVGILVAARPTGGHKKIEMEWRENVDISSGFIGTANGYTLQVGLQLNG
jgi:hypothetical protein